MPKRFSNKTKSHQLRFLHEVRRLDTSAQNQMRPPRLTLDAIEQQQQEAEYLDINWFTLAAHSWDWFRERGRGFMSMKILCYEPDGKGTLVKADYFSRSDVEKMSVSRPKIQYYLKAIETYDPSTQILVLLNQPHSQVVNINCFTPPLTPEECWQQFQTRSAQSTSQTRVDQV